MIAIDDYAAHLMQKTGRVSQTRTGEPHKSSRPIRPNRESKFPILHTCSNKIIHYAL